jgi:hypothetical protein
MIGMRNGAVVELARRRASYTGPDRPTAGAKRLALLRAAVVTAGLRGSRVLQAACDDELAGTRLADGSLAIAPALCDALVELMAALPIDLVPGDAA